MIEYVIVNIVYIIYTERRDITMELKVIDEAEATINCCCCDSQHYRNIIDPPDDPPPEEEPPEEEPPEE